MPYLVSGRPAVAVALGAGALRGAAHIGVLSVLEQERIPVDVLAGSSIGAIVGVLYASGRTPDDLRELILSLQPGQVFDSNLRPLPIAKMALKSALDYLHFPSAWLGPTPLGLIPGERLRLRLHQWTGGRGIQQLKKPFVAVATALETGQRVLFGPPECLGLDANLDIPTVAYTEVPASFAARASAAIPGVFEPVLWDGYTLADGGLVDTVPADVLRAMGADVVIAVALGLRGNPPSAVRDVAEVVDQSLSIIVNTMSRLDACHGADVVVAPAVPARPLTDFSGLRDAIAAGETAARKALPDIKAVLRERGWQG